MHTQPCYIPSPIIIIMPFCPVEKEEKKKRKEKEPPKRQFHANFHPTAPWIPHTNPRPQIAKP